MIEGSLPENIDEGNMTRIPAIIDRLMIKLHAERSVLYFLVIAIIGSSAAIFIVNKVDNAVSEIENNDLLKITATTSADELYRRTNSKTLDTSNWQTYRNEQYGFEMRYPTYIILSEKYIGNSLLFTFKDADSKDIFSQLLFFDIYPSKYETIEAYEAFLKKSEKECSNDKTTKHCRQYKLAYEKISEIFLLKNIYDNDQKEVWFIHNDFFFSMKGKTLENGFGIDQILSTFRFTN